MEVLHNPYRYIWHKYRPVILRLMVDAANCPQQYSFSDHEFTQIAPKNRTSLAFILYLHRLKALNNIKSSPLAHGLLEILKESQTAARLTQSSVFEFILDKHFVLHVERNKEIAAVGLPIDAASMPEGINELSDIQSG
jgi:hypothetical protein